MATKKQDEKKVTSPIKFENAKIIFPNFMGKQGQFNPEGKRNFCVKLDPEIAEILTKDGWNVKWLEPRDPDDDRQPYLPINVKYGDWPPQIWLINESGKTMLEESNVNILDWAEIVNADLIVTPYNWEFNNRTGITAYLRTAYFTIQEDEFAKKYKNVPDTAARCIGDNCPVDASPPWDDD